MSLKLKKPLFVNDRDVVLRSIADGKGRKTEANHLIMGDYVQYLGEEKSGWLKVRSRRTNGWLRKSSLTNERMLEVNFVDIGQGDGCHIVTPNDEVILIDAGEGKGFDGNAGDNMARFLNWRYNLRGRKVVGVDGVKKTTPDSTGPFEIDHVVISHPDLDHYYGFQSIFQNKKLRIRQIYHNGLVERSGKPNSNETWFKDLGLSTKVGNTTYIIDTIKSDAEMKTLLDSQSGSGKYYIKTLRSALENNSKIKFEILDSSKRYMGPFKGRNKVHIEVLAPVLEKIEFKGNEVQCLRKLGSEGETKNGHSVVLRLIHGKLKMILGGDLNIKSQDFLAQHYSKIDVALSVLEKKIKRLREKLSYQEALSVNNRKDLEQQLEEAQKLLELIVSRTKKYFQCDIAKACHHGASDILDSFLFTYNPIATVISSGDNESHSHPRPDALGAFGRSSRGNRPLIFSTELARSSKEFSYPIKFFSLLKRIEDEMNMAQTKKKKKHYYNRMQKLKDSNIAKYGMITVRSNGENVIIAQMLEKKRSNGQRWEIYELNWNPKLQEFEYE